MFKSVKNVVIVGEVGIVEKGFPARLSGPLCRKPDNYRDDMLVEKTKPDGTKTS